MNPIFQKIIFSTIKNYHRKKKLEGNEKPLKKRIRDIEVEIKHELYDIIYLLTGVISASFGLKGFLLPGSFIDGGVTGISLIVKELTSM